MLFTNFFKSKGKENQPQADAWWSSKSEAAILKPSTMGVVNNLNDRSLPVSFGLDSNTPTKSSAAGLSNSSVENAANGCRPYPTPTMTRIGLTPFQKHPQQRIRTQCEDQDEDWNPLHRMQLRKSQAKERSRSHIREQSKVIIGETNPCDQRAKEPPQKASEDVKLCINCDAFVPISKVDYHEKRCAGYDKLLLMSKQELFMFVHSKIAKDQVRLNELKRNTLQGTVIGNASSLATDLQSRIDQLHKVRNGIMTRLL